VGHWQGLTGLEGLTGTCAGLHSHHLSDRPSSIPAPDLSYQHEVTIAQTSGLTGEVADVLHRLESKMMFEISRVELEAQAAHRALSTDLAKWRKEREAAWKHVGELKEQSRLLRQRNYELEVQNGHLHRHIMLLQEQLSGMSDQRTQYETAVRMAAAGQHAQVQGVLAEAARNQALLHHLGMSLSANAAAVGAGVAPPNSAAAAGAENSAAAANSLASALAAVTLPGGVGSPFTDAHKHPLGVSVGGPGIIGDKKGVPRLPHSGADIW